MDHPVPSCAHPGVRRAWPAGAARTAVRGLDAAAAMFPDISEFEDPPFRSHPVDWDALEAAYRVGEILGVAIRAGFGMVRADASFERNRSEARARCIPAIYYWFAYPAYNAADAEAKLFNEVVGQLAPGEAQALDIEDDPQAEPFLRGSGGRAWIERFLTLCASPQNATWWYTYPSLLYELGLTYLANTWPCWAAVYGGPVPAGAMAVQFTDAGSTPGVDGPCDQSRVLQGPLARWLTPSSSPAAPSSGGPLMALSDDQQAQLLEKVNVLHASWCTNQPAGNTDPQQITALDRFEEAYNLVKALPAPAPVDVDALAAKLADALVPHLPPGVDPATVAADIVARLGKDLTAPGA